MEAPALLHLVGTRIKLIRTTKGIKQIALANACGFKKANLSRIESGKQNFTMLTLQKIATQLDLSIGAFFHK